MAIRHKAIRKRKQEHDDKVPKAHVIGWGEPGREGNRSVFVACPLCGEVHSHGATAEEFEQGGNLGHRVEHCTPSEDNSTPKIEGEPGYYIWAARKGGRILEKEDK
jgi:hypothetical protein